jgi:hypothetical protein
MDYRVERLRTPDECEIFAANAIARKRPDLAMEAHRKAVELQAATHEASSPVEAEAFAALYAYEALLARKNGKKTRATKTWAVVKSRGVIEAIRQCVNGAVEPESFARLRELGLETHAFDALVVRNAASFDDATVRVAQSRLADG